MKKLEPTFAQPLTEAELRGRWSKWTDAQRETYRYWKELADDVGDDKLAAANFAAYKVEALCDSNG